MSKIFFGRPAPDPTSDDPGHHPLQAPDPSGSAAGADVAWRRDPGFAPLPEVVDDLAALEAQLAAATGQDRIWLPRVLGRLERAAAVGEQSLDAGLMGWWALPQVASPNHSAGRFGHAAQVQTEALSLADTAVRVATTRRRIGKRRFDQRDDTDVSAEPDTARRVRARAGAARDLSVSMAMSTYRAHGLGGR